MVSLQNHASNNDNDESHREQLVASVTSERIKKHPCYNAKACFHYARLHLAIAPRCNIQCNYCNRKYDCANECRPGVTSERLTPEEALLKTRIIHSKMKNLSVVGIAGPGDPLANPEEVFRTLRLINAEFPDLELCLSTNGLNLPNYIDDLVVCGVRYVTITINAIDPNIGEKIYSWINDDHVIKRGKIAAEVLWHNQSIGLQELARKNIIVKVNTVLIPGINDHHIPEIAHTISKLGAYIHNIIPLIPVQDTLFAKCQIPSHALVKKLQDTCKKDILVMKHCQRCRADAVGLLNQDCSQELTFQRITSVSQSLDSSEQSNLRETQGINLSGDRCKICPQGKE